MYSSGNIDVRNWVHLFESPCIIYAHTEIILPAKIIKQNISKGKTLWVISQTQYSAVSIQKQCSVQKLKRLAAANRSCRYKRNALLSLIMQRVVIIPYRQVVPERSVRNCHYSLRNDPEERCSHLLRGESLKSRAVNRDYITDVIHPNTSVKISLGQHVDPERQWNESTQNI